MNRKLCRPAFETVEQRRLLAALSLDDVKPGTAGSSPSNLTGVGDVLFFSADNGSTGIELWKTLGGVGQSSLVKDINSGAISSNPANLTAFNGKLYFTADDGINGNELWCSDGTTSGTVLLADINPGAGSSSAFEFQVYDGALYFAANDGSTGTELWKTNGTPIGTTRVAEINVGPDGSLLSDLTVSGGTLFFSANDGVNGAELWKYDGVSVSMAMDIYPGPTSSDPYSLVDAGGKLFFASDDGSHGAELWSATSTSVALVRDVRVGVTPSYPYAITALGSSVYFGADSGLPGTELMRSDGTFDGTVVAKDLIPGFASSYPYLLTVCDTSLYFVADVGLGDVLWKFDGTNATNVSGGLALPRFPYELRASGTTLYFTAASQAGSELWKTTTSSTQATRVGATPSGVTPADPFGLYFFRNQCYFAGSDATTGIELYVDDIQAPKIVDAVLDVELSQKIGISVSEPLGSSFTVNDITVTNTATSVVVPQSNFSFTADAASNRVFVTLNGTGTTLGNGNYRLSVPAGAFTDLLGRANSAAYSFDFFLLAGDANHDKRVDFTDLLTVAQNYGQSGKTFSGGNFDYSAAGEVTFSDLLIIAQNYGVSLATTTSTSTLKRSRNSDVIT